MSDSRGQLPAAVEFGLRRDADTSFLSAQARVRRASRARSRVVACFIPKEQIQGSLTMMLSGLSAKTNMGKKLMAAAGASLLFAAAS